MPKQTHHDNDYENYYDNGNEHDDEHNYEDDNDGGDDNDEGKYTYKQLTYWQIANTVRNNNYKCNNKMWK